MSRIAAVLAAMFLIAGCVTGSASPAAPSTSGPPTGTPPASIATARPTPGATARLLAGQPMASCLSEGRMAQCGTLVVPEDPSKPDGRTIALKVVVIPALASNAAPDPVFMLAGGPGGAATISMAWTANLFGAIHATRDIVLVDQRGTGRSNQLWLKNPPDLTGRSDTEIRKAIRRWATDAFATLDADASTYTTAVAMDDLDRVRAALGYETINLYGASYGATAAQYYMRQHPDRIRTVVLDGATLLDVPVMERIAGNSQRALDILFERCAADTACARAYPQLRADWTAVLDTLGHGSIDTGVEQPFGSGTIRLDRTTFTGAVHQGLLESRSSSSLPWLIHAAASGSWDLVGRTIAATMQAPDPGILVMSGIIRCSEAWARFDPDETRRVSKGSYYLEAELAQATNQFLACPFAPKGIVPADDGAAATGSMPVLFVVGQADPQDPPENIADAPADLPNSTTVVVPGEGHTVGHLGCLPSVIDAFVLAGNADGLDVSCVAAMQPPGFRMP